MIFLLILGYFAAILDYSGAVVFRSSGLLCCYFIVLFNAMLLGCFVFWVILSVIINHYVHNANDALHVYVIIAHGQNR